MTDVELEKLTPRQQKVLAALLSCPNIATASKNCGVPVRTIYGYTRTPSFAKVYRERRAAQVWQATAWGQAFASPAIIRAGHMINDAMTKPALQLAACKVILDFALRMTEIESVADRIDDLEQRLEAMTCTLE